MQSGVADRHGSPSKRTLARGMSEDESLRIIISETETPSRRLARSDSRSGTLKRKSGSQQCDQDIFKTLPDVMELQASYEEVVQERRGLELEREALLFQVDVLQDSLESVEELLAEAHREAGQARTEAELGRMTNRTLEDKVRALTTEVERLNEERDALATLQKHALILEEAKAYSTLDQEAPSTLEQEAPSTLALAPSTLAQAPITQAPAPSSEEPWSSPLQKLADITLSKMSTLALVDPRPPEGVRGRPDGWRLEEEEDERNNDTDSVGAYEDASADTPDLDPQAFPGPGEDDDDDDERDGGEEEERGGGTDPRDPKDQDPNSSCVLS
ncbi:leucine-rich repeat flightless-interacting protein 2 isoform X1 [Gadus chalcogrammus]|uniref:leucine-rich repeat flightless-interacting protein 2 isoform X1 n=1 Tax=Gadus chalcogrammus TaxID=1042646 RepID=UPI0024C49DDE|nr:leucine-rich repeat flightless-interacting protein 2 isoform X1 [Gadus chalcogrammus]